MSIFQFYQPLTGVVRHLLILNVLMFIGSYALLGNESWNQQTGEVINLGRLVLAVYMPGSEHFQPFQIVTHMFMHGDLGHLAFNMLSLYFFGPMVEMAFGSKRFLFYYLFCGLGAFRRLDGRRADAARGAAQQLGVLSAPAGGQADQCTGH